MSSGSVIVAVEAIILNACIGGMGVSAASLESVTPLSLEGV
jgi:hypothetical protein